MPPDSYAVRYAALLPTSIFLWQQQNETMYLWGVDMAISEKRISKIITKINSGNALGWGDVLYYEQYIFQQNNFKHTNMFSTSYSAAKLYVDAGSGRFYATPLNTSEYAFRIYNKSEIEDIRREVNSNTPADPRTARTTGALLGGIIGSTIAENIAKSQNLVTFVGLAIRFRDGSQRFINFISPQAPVKFDSWKYKSVMQVVTAAYDLLKP